MRPSAFTLKCFASLKFRNIVAIAPGRHPRYLRLVNGTVEIGESDVGKCLQKGRAKSW